MTSPAGPPQSATVEALEPRALMAAGALDPAFGNPAADGIARHALLTDIDERPGAAVRQPDGRILVAGAAGDYNDDRLAVERFLPDGTPDPSFGEAGKVRLPYTAGSATAIALQPDGKILLAGRATIVRLNADGSPDASFGKGGALTLPPLAGHPNEDVDLAAVALLPDGRVAVAGTTFVDIHEPAALVARLTPAGRLDPTFGDAGVRRLDLRGDERLAALKALPRGALLAAGASANDFLLLKLDRRGDLDPAFGDGSAGVPGAAVVNFSGGGDSANDLVTLADRSIVVAGRAGGGGFALARFTADGRPFQRFGDGGRLTIDFGQDLSGFRTGSAAAITLDPRDGKLVVAGSGGSTVSDSTFAVARLTSRGKLDRAFGTGGRVTLDAGNGRPANATAVTVTADGGVLLAGQTGPQGSPAGDTLLARLTPGGQLDPAFANVGTVVTSFRAPAAVYDGDSAVPLPGGKVMLVHGIARTVAGRPRTDVALTRFNPDGSVDATFADAGTAYVDLGVTSGGSPVVSPTLDPKGRILLAMLGNATDDTFEHFPLLVAAVRAADGSLDRTFGAAGIATFPDTRVDLDPGAIAFQNGRILVAGGNRDFPINTLPHDRAHAELAVLRLTPEGAIDTTFGDAGRAGIPVGPAQDPESFPYLAAATHLAVQPDGRIVALGYQGYMQLERFSLDSVALARFTADGRPDTSFGADHTGLVTPAPYGDPADLALLPDGRILVAASAADPSPDGNPYDLRTDFSLLRFLADGRPDPAFGTAGRAVVPFPGRRNDDPSAILVQADGKYVLGGGTGDGFIGLARLTAAGRLDPTFGDSGLVRTRVAPPSEYADSYYTYAERHPRVTLLPAAGGRVLSAGVTAAGAFLARYLGDQTPAITVDVVDGTLRVRGTPGHDRVTLRRDPAPPAATPAGAVEVVGLPQRFDPATFSRVEVDGGAGDDRLDLSRLAVPATLVGGAGDDVLLAGAADDLLQGDAGNDTLFGGKGRDTFRAGDGNDYLNPGPGADHAFGDAGDDQFFAADGAVDRLDGGPGFDRVKSDFDDLAAAVEAPLF